tara:strand:+ start:1142 stop:1375 length:234 start_codon:yes stop_codon:yes gene_type:complete
MNLFKLKDKVGVQFLGFQLMLTKQVNDIYSIFKFIVKIYKFEFAISFGKEGKYAEEHKKNIIKALKESQYNDALAEG